MARFTKLVLAFFTVFLLFSCQFQEKVEAVTTVAQQSSDVSSNSILNNWNFRSNIKNDQANAPFEWWIWEAAKYGVSEGKVEAYGVKDGYAFIKLANSGNDVWHIQLNQWVKLKQKQYYLVSFKAKADEPRTINVKVLMNHDPWVAYFAQTVELGKDWNTYTFYFKHPDKADETVNFCFELGKYAATTIYISEVVLKPVDESEVPEDQRIVEEQPETVEYDFDEEEPDNLVNDGDFAYKIVNDQGSMPSEWWIWEAGKYGISPAKVSGFGVENGVGFVTLENTGFETWHVQFNQWVKLRKGNSYVISFKAKAAEPRKIWVKLVQTGAPYGVYFSQEVNLTSEWQTFTFEYKHPQDCDPVVTFSFELGKEAPTTVYFDDISISPKK